MSFKINPNHYFNKEIHLNNKECEVSFSESDILNKYKLLYPNFPILIIEAKKSTLYNGNKENIIDYYIDNQLSIDVKDTNELVLIQIHNNDSDTLISINGKCNLIHYEISLGKHINSSLEIINIDNLNYHNMIVSNLNKILLHNYKKINNHGELNIFIMQNNSNHIVKNDMQIFLHNDSTANIQIFNDIQKNQIKDDAIEIVHLLKNTQSKINYISLNQGTAISQINSIIEKEAVESSLEQHIKHILTHENAKSLSKPSLIIHSPTVASHGNTISSYPENWLFYLYQKGIDKHRAEIIMKESYINNFCLNTNYTEEFKEYFIGNQNEKY